MFNVDPADLKMSLDDASQFQENSMDFAIMSKTYREAPRQSNNSLDFAIMSKTYREPQKRPGEHRKEFVSLETSLCVPEESQKDEYGATVTSSREEMEVMSRRKEKFNAQQKRLLGFATRLGLLAVISLVSSF